MKSLLCLFLMLIFSFPASSLADDNSVRGAIGTEKKIKPATGEQLEEAFQVSDECKSYPYTNTRYDCDCLGMTFLELRRQEGDGASAFMLTEQAKKKCPNTTEVAGMIYTSCLEWAPAERGEGYKEFCSCYGSEYAKIYAKAPSENQLVREYQMTRALSKCNVGSVDIARQERYKIIKK